MCLSMDQFLSSTNCLSWPKVKASSQLLLLVNYFCWSYTASNHSEKLKLTDLNQVVSNYLIEEQQYLHSDYHIVSDSEFICI